MSIGWALGSVRARDAIQARDDEIAIALDQGGVRSSAIQSPK